MAREHHLGLIEALDEDARRVIHREVKRPADDLHPPSPGPVTGGGQQSLGDGIIFQDLEKAKACCFFLQIGIAAMIDPGHDSTHHLTAPPSHKWSSLTMTEKAASLWIELALPLVDQRGHPLGIVAVNAPGKADKDPAVPLRRHWLYPQPAGSCICHEAAPCDVSCTARWGRL